MWANPTPTAPTPAGGGGGSDGGGGSATATEGSEAETAAGATAAHATRSFSSGSGGSFDDGDDAWDDEGSGGLREWYTFGIIDILQEFNARKQAEGFVKAKVLGKEEVSAVNPGLYAGRFVAFLEKHTV